MKITFNDIKGYEKEKNEIKNLVKMFNNYDKYKKLGISLPKGLIFYGQPGVGKTLFSIALAAETKRSFIEMKFIGLSEKEILKEIQTTFEKAKNNVPAIIFIDEIDKLVSEEKGLRLIARDDSKTTLALLLQLFDGFTKNDEIMVVATTNYLDRLPKALIRSGRIDKYIHLQKPDDNSRKEIINYYLDKVDYQKNIDIKQFILSSEGLTGADIKNVINKSFISTMNKNQKEVTTVDILEEIQTLIHKSQLEPLTDEESHVVAYHELGHYVVGKHFKKEIKDVTINQGAGSLGMVRYKRPSYVRTTRNVLEDVTVLFGGKAAENIFLKDDYLGSSSDIMKAYSILEASVTSGAFGIEYFEVTDDYQKNLLSSKNKEKINELLESCYQEAIKIVTKNKNMIEILHPLLMEKKILSNSEIEDYINSR